jgi:hypothetical protein
MGEVRRWTRARQAVGHGRAAIGEYGAHRWTRTGRALGRGRNTPLGANRTYREAPTKRTVGHEWSTPSDERGARCGAPTERAQSVPLDASGARRWARAELVCVYLVMLCRTTSAQRRSGDCKKGERKVWSTSTSRSEGYERAPRCAGADKTRARFGRAVGRRGPTTLRASRRARMKRARGHRRRTRLGGIDRWAAGRQVSST